MPLTLALNPIRLDIAIRDTTPGLTWDALLLEDGVFGVLLEDGTSYLLLEF